MHSAVVHQKADGHNYINAALEQLSAEGMRFSRDCARSSPLVFEPLFRDHAASDTVASGSRRIGLHVVSFRMYHERGPAIGK